METFTDIIAKFPDGVLASGLKTVDGEEVGRAAIALWKHRKTIPTEYWAQLVALAKTDRKTRKVTAELLVEIAAKRKRAA